MDEEKGLPSGLTRKTLPELYSMLVEVTSSMESDRDREKAMEIVRAMIIVANNLRFSLEGINPRAVHVVLAKLGDELSKLQSALAEVHMLLAAASERAVRKAVIGLGKHIGALSVWMTAPRAAPLGGLLAGVDTSEIAIEDGGVAARVYSYILSRGRVSSKLLSRWATSQGLDRDEVEEALRRLIEKGYVRAEAAVGEVEYVPSLPGEG